MGRWAEVYFTSPPEKREQAVLELLRELQGENPAHDTTSVAPAPVALEQATEPEVSATPSIAEGPQTEIRCHMCGRENPASHRFCGMCGRSLAELPATTGIHVADLQVADLHIEDLIEERPQDRPAPSAGFVYEPTLHANELSLFPGGREAGSRDDRSNDIFSDPPATRSYRVPVGIAVAMVIFALGFMAWRNSQNTSRSSHIASQVPTTAATAQPTEPAPAPPGTSKADNPEQPPASTPAADVAPRGAAAEAASEEAAAKNRRDGDQVAKAVPPSTSATEKNPPAETLAGNGAAELSIAQRYLNGTDGERRNPAEAAKWLWKAMGKHNGNATVLLADLYLKGEGVPKNCDQARILLDSAALRGMKDAGERLRHLQAFGCN